MRHPRTLAALALALTAPLLLAPAADGGTRMPISFDDTRIVSDENLPGDATTSLAGCATAVSVDQRVHAAFPKPHGVFIGIRDFQCGGGDGFVVRLTARFGEGGSSGSWSIVTSYGDLAGMSGSGKLVGEPFGDDGIIDHYTGWVTLH